MELVFESDKDRILQQFIHNQPMGNQMHVEEVEMELDFMVEEGVDLAKITLRDVLNRF